MKPLLKLLLSSCLIILLGVGYIYAQEDNFQKGSPIILSDKQDRYPLGLYLETLEDPTGHLTIDDIILPEIALQFVANQNEIPNFGLSDSAYWVRFWIKNEANQNTNWQLEMKLAGNELYRTLHTDR